jgi:hypothetical protein
MKLEDIKKQMSNAVISTQKQKETKEAEITKLQERLAQVLIGIDDALLNDNEESLTKLTNEKREIEEKINLYNGFLKDFKNKPILRDETAQNLFNELLKTIRTSDHHKKYESVKELLKQLDSKAKESYNYIKEVQNISDDLCSLSGHGRNTRYGISFYYESNLQTLMNYTRIMLNNMAGDEKKG